TERELSVGSKQGRKSAKLVPPGVQLPPLLVVSIFFSASVVLLLCCHVAVFYAEASNVHSPIRNTAHGKVESGRYLRFHVLPACANVSTPRSSGIALQAGKPRPG